MITGLWGALGDTAPAPNTSGATGQTGSPSGTPGNLAATSLPGFLDGAKLWASPSNAVTALGVVVSVPSTAFSPQVAPFTIGLLAVPVALIGVAFMMSKR